MTRERKWTAQEITAAIDKVMWSPASKETIELLDELGIVRPRTAYKITVRFEPYNDGAWDVDRVTQMFEGSMGVGEGTDGRWSSAVVVPE